MIVKNYLIVGQALLYLNLSPSTAAGETRTPGIQNPDSERFVVGEVVLRTCLQQLMSKLFDALDNRIIFVERISIFIKSISKNENIRYIVRSCANEPSLIIFYVEN